MNLLTLDTETYYTPQYSLSKITTEEYIRSPLFETIGVGLKLNDGPTVWVPKPDVPRALGSIDWDNTMLLAQNTAFDAAILAWRYGIVPAAYADTLGMSRALFPHARKHSLEAQAERIGVGAKGDEVMKAIGKRFADFTPEELKRYGRYCKNDVNLTYKLFMHYMGMGFPKKEMRLVDLTIRMFTQPALRLDAAHLNKHYRNVVESKAQLMDVCRDALVSVGTAPEALTAIMNDGGLKKMLMSNDRFAMLLEHFGVEPPRKVSKTTRKETYAFAKTDDAFTELLEHEDYRVQSLVAARLGNKSTLEETRTLRFIGAAARGAFPIPLRYYAAHLGRWGGCLTADTEVTVYDPGRREVRQKAIVDVLADDLVWDGEAFVAHEGVQFSGYQEVITWDGVTGTEDHVVFTEAGEISLGKAAAGGHRIQTARSPEPDDMVSAWRSATDHEG